jgi:precorrin-3B methylase
MILAKVLITQVDMLSLVIIGNRESKCLQTTQQQWVYTPRGYKNKL